MAPIIKLLLYTDIEKKNESFGCPYKTQGPITQLEYLRSEIAIGIQMCYKIKEPFFLKAMLK